MSDARADLAIRLIEERARLGLSQADMARQLDVSREGLRLYEAGQRGMAAEFLAAAAGLGVDVQYVLSGLRSTNVADLQKAQAAPLVNIADTKGNVVGVVQAGGTVHQINTARHVTKTVAEVKPGEVHIDESQAATLTELVNQVVETEAKLRRDPKTHRAVWAALNAHCGVTRYRLIPAADFEKARKYLHQWMGRLSSMASAPVVDGDAWRKRKYSYIKINSRDDQDAVAAYMKKNFKATSLTELSNDALEQVYRYVASRKRRPS